MELYFITNMNSEGFGFMLKSPYEKNVQYNI